MEFRDVVTNDGSDPRGLRGVSFHVKAGEILGVAGVAGNGQEELGEVLLGLRHRKAGEIFLFGEAVNGRSISSLLQLGVRYIPEDALAMAVVPQMQVGDNLVLGDMHKYGSAGIWLNRRGIRETVQRIISRFPIALAKPQARVEQLSGGNIQRVVLARELIQMPKVLVAYYPTRGLDLLTAETTRRLLIEHRENGAAVVLISEDLDELLGLSDRLIVMYQGNIVGELRPGDASVHEIGLLMTGHHE